MIFAQGRGQRAAQSPSTLPWRRGPHQFAKPSVGGRRLVEIGYRSIMGFGIDTKQNLVEQRLFGREPRRR
jgi:hypothetical protein